MEGPAPPPPAPTPPASAPDAPPEARARPMCYACGNYLTPADVRCSSCGAPVRTIHRNRRPGSLTVGAVLLLGFAVLLALAGYVSFDNPAGSVEVGSNNPVVGGTYSLSGTARFANGTAAQGVNVTSAAQAETYSVTDENGTYGFERLSFGHHRFLYQVTNHTTVELSVVLIGPDTSADITLEPGNGTRTEEHPSVQRAAEIVRTAGGIVVGISVLMLGSSMACFARRWFPVAVAGPAVGMLTGLFFLPNLLLGLIGLVLVLRNRKTFR